MKSNGIAHVMLTVSNFDAGWPFHEKILTCMGLQPVIPLRVGLPHACFRIPGKRLFADGRN